MTMETLDGLTILVPESRELDLFAGLLEAQGARPLRCPLVRIVDVDDDRDAQAWITRMIDMPFDFTVLLTGEGLRRLLSLSGPRRDDLVGALAKTRTVTRGPKPARALREIGLSPGMAAAEPTSQGVLEELEEEKLEKKRIGVQLYPGDGALPLVEALRTHGAEVFPVTPYRYASQTESAQVAATIKELAAGNIGMIAFTSSPQIERLFAVAEEHGLLPELTVGLARTTIAAIGPVVETALKARGLSSAIHPESSFHLKPMINAIAEAWKAKP
ncbi:MAG TPA: uroporphyrinogen-III synthase [Rhizomicrobium sp.]|nr:uroporphyrinogen-III synthase [Rhizomicrobium sp.]